MQSQYAASSAKSLFPSFASMSAQRLICVMICLFGLVATAKAADTPLASTLLPGLDLSLGAGLLVAPSYAGSNGRKVTLAPYINGSFKDLVDFDFYDGVRFNALRFGDMSVGPMARYRYGRSEADAPELRGMGRINDGIEFGGFIGFDHGPYSAELLAVRDMTSGNAGILMEGRAAIAIPIGAGGLEFGPFVQFADQDYMQTFYGIDRSQSLGSGRAVFSPAAGIDKGGLELNATLPLSDRISLRGFLAYDRLLNDAARSSLVERDGSQDQMTAGLFLVYRP